MKGLLLALFQRETFRTGFLSETSSSPSYPPRVEGLG